MKLFSRKRLITIAIISIAPLCGALFAAVTWQKPQPKTDVPQVEIPAPAAEKPAETKLPEPRRESIGTSVEGRPIESYTFGNGKTLAVFVGGIHGGYEWNSTLLAYELIDYLTQDPKSIPDGLKVTVIPSLNPDGTFRVVGKDGRFSISDVADNTGESGRLNANKVDLNRNFDCKWQAQGVWKNKTVSGGTAAFSEPESAAFREFVLKKQPAAAVFYHSQSNAIYGSQCGGGMLAQTGAMMGAYSQASRYKTAPTFDGYQVTGDVTDWLASIGIPAMSVELATHKNTERERNLAGIQALFDQLRVEQK